MTADQPQTRGAKPASHGAAPETAAKSPEAFRTISEVADWLDTPAHVLRFWESKFTQIRPVKRAGGRRYYRPEDMALLGGIKVLLHEQGLTIKGVQKILREQGAKEVAVLGSQRIEGTGWEDDRSVDIQPVSLTESLSGSPTASPTENMTGALPDSGTALASEISTAAALEPDPLQAPPTARQGVIRLLRQAGPVLLRRRRQRIRPLLTRLETLSARMAAG